MAPVTFLVGGPAGWGGGGISPRGTVLGVATLAAPARPVPTGVLYTSLLLLHVLCAVVGFGTVVVTGVQAARARRGSSVPGAEGVQRYFRPGVNWAGRALYGVPVFGFCLIGASQGAFGAADGFVVIGLALWLTAALVAEAVVWPGERRIQVQLPEIWAQGENGFPGVHGAAAALDRECRRVAVSAAALAVLFVAATVIMVGKP